jgi:AraC family transcriptional regulator of adaptative response/methylated-DNA-[protein]-cysteine methyltransferase
VDLVRRVCRHIEDHGDGPPTLRALGERAGVSPFHLQRTFKRIIGITPRQYAEKCRLDRLKANLRGGDDVTGAIYGAGYGSDSRLYERANEHLGMTPGTYRRGGQGMRIGYTTVDCPLGRLLVAATERGLCAVSLGDSDPELEVALRVEYPNAEIGRDVGDLDGWVAAILGYLDGQTTRLDLPLDIRVTAFQWRVYEALRSIPVGSTRTYGEVAASLGRPGAARAVGRSCATNPVALVIPCHRAVRGDGGPGGYRWGLGRKARLLAMERRDGSTEGEVDPEEDRNAPTTTRSR